MQLRRKMMNDLKKKILDLVVDYFNEYHKKKPFDFGNSKIGYGGRFYDEKEIVNLVDSSLDFWLTAGPWTEKFESKMGKFLNVKKVHLTNSGSSANLLAFSALTSPLLKDRKINKSDEVITVACGFPTTVTPIIQYGAIPVFIDVDETYNIDISKLDGALSEKTKAVMVAHTLGNPFNLKAVKQFCDNHNLWLIEDNCDALGSKYYIDGKWMYTGTIGDIGTSSFYPPHHITMGEGGAVYTNNLLLSKIMLSIRDWGRDCWCKGGVDNTCGVRFSRQYGELPYGYDHKYVYSHFGYNLKVTDMQAAIGCAQLDKLEYIIEKRIENHKYLFDKLQPLSKYFILPIKQNNSDPSWFGFTITIKDNVNFTRNEITSFLETNGIQTRLLFSGNLLKHPAFSEMKQKGEGYRVYGDLTNTDKIMNDTFWLGVYPGLNTEHLDYITSKIFEFIDKLSN